MEKHEWYWSIVGTIVILALLIVGLAGAITSSINTRNARAACNAVGASYTWTGGLGYGCYKISPEPLASENWRNR